jgi:hypothetical protein
VRIDRSADDVSAPDSPDAPMTAAGDASWKRIAGVGAASGSAEPGIERDAGERVGRVLDNRAKVEADYRAYAIDQGYERVREVECNVVTPAMRRIEAEDPNRHLAGLEHRLKGKERLAEKVEKWMSAQPDLRPDQAFGLVKDAIRYTFVYEEAGYADGVCADCRRLQSEGFEPADRENSWKNDQYKGINGRWREPISGRLFEVQFHTQASLSAKEDTHPAYERIRDPSTSPEEIKQLKAYQREVNAMIPVPPNATEILDYNLPQEALMTAKTTYYAFVTEFSSRELPGGVVRRTENKDGEYDEAFTRDLAWERTPLLYAYERGNRDAEFYQISEDEANRIVERIRRTVTGGA